MVNIFSAIGGYLNRKETSLLLGDMTQIIVCSYLVKTTEQNHRLTISIDKVPYSVCS